MYNTFMNFAYTCTLYMYLSNYVFVYVPVIWKSNCQTSKFNDVLLTLSVRNWPDGTGDGPKIDPVEYCEHIQSEVKKAKQRLTEKKFNQVLSPEQIQEEKAMQRQQLEAIFKLMKDQDKQFGVGCIEDVQSQMKLYAQVLSSICGLQKYVVLVEVVIDLIEPEVLQITVIPEHWVKCAQFIPKPVISRD